MIPGHFGHPCIFSKTRRAVKRLVLPSSCGWSSNKKMKYRWTIAVGPMARLPASDLEQLLGVQSADH
jgi:hypothetical protein